MSSNIWGIIIVSVLGLIAWLIKKAIDDKEKNFGEFKDSIHDKFRQVDEHIANTDRNVKNMEIAHNELKLNIVGELNSLKIEILSKLNEMSLEIVKWKNKS